MDDDRVCLPIRIDSTSNGEFVPVPLPDALTRARREAVRAITENARRLGQGRRAFLRSLCGAATTLLAYNQAFASQGQRGGAFAVHPESAFDFAQAQSQLGGSEFIFDVQLHMVDTRGQWRQGPGKAFERFLAWIPQGKCGEADPVDCFSAQHLIKEVFLDSDTTMAVLSFVPAPPERNSLTLAEAARVRTLVSGLGNSRRLLLHAMILPNLPPLELQLQRMREAVAEWDIAAFKTYTQWGPNGLGWALNDERIGIPFIEQARALGVRNICVHKGLSLQGQDKRFSDCADVGPAARRFPDMNFIIYHSGFETSRREGPYDPANAGAGIDSLVKSLHDNGIAPNSNVYAELGSTWRFVMRDPTNAAHTLGKLIQHVGVDRVLWGTDSIWYGSPQDQILAFRAFQIAEPLRERHGYAELTPQLKAKIFGLNAAVPYRVDVPAVIKKGEQDILQRTRTQYAEAAEPSWRSWGPRDRRSFLEHLRGTGGMP